VENARASRVVGDGAIAIAHFSIPNSDPEIADP
jgi:hypothetical protein